MDKVVIIPTYNERENIDEMLTRLLALPHGLDVLIVDDHSPDGTAEAVRQWMGRDGRVRSVHAGFASPATGEEHVRLKKELRELVEQLVAEPARSSAGQ